MFSEFVEQVGEMIRRLLNILNWRLVRTMGELQILTRASYILIVAVPLLAALWPAVKLAVNSERRAIDHASQVLHGTSAELETTVLLMRQAVPSNKKSAGAGNAATLFLVQADRIEKAANRIKQAADQYAKDLDQKVLADPAMPWTLAATFFAALAVVLGHVVYQINAPEPVRRMAWDAFVISRKEDFAKHPTEDAMDRAQRFLGTRQGRRLMLSTGYEADEILSRLEYQSDEERKVYIAGMPREQVISLMVWIDSNLSSAPKDHQQKIREIARKLIGIPSEDAQYEQFKRMTIIERGARAEYLQHAGKAPGSIILTVFLYGIALWIIAAVIKVQAVSVADAAALSSIFDILIH